MSENAASVSNIQQAELRVVVVMLIGQVEVDFTNQC